jgi:flavin reductase (DIM6/NTAB) family NADH-FMN oxidoreductase RutF
MQQTFEHYWIAYAQWVVAWTNAVLAPPEPHVQRLLESAQRLPALAAAIANAFDDPRTVDPWWFNARAADRLIAEKEAEGARGLDLRDLRNALGQFATGVTVVTAAGANGRRVGVTANSFTSLSLEPPLVLWALARESTSLPAFRQAGHFAVNVLAAGQHHLSRLFATSGADKFGGVELRPGAHGIPLLDGALAHYICRGVRQIDAGDHVIFIGEVESYELFDGEPLVFHSGTYRVTTRHPDLD